MASINKPFVKWLGGKTNLLGRITSIYSNILSCGDVKVYIEPFCGEAAVFFTIFQYVEKCILNDLNTSLMLTYRAIRDFYDELVMALRDYKIKYLSLCPEKQMKMYYDTRLLFNGLKSSLSLYCDSKSCVDAASMFIFLNKTSFNGLYRENLKGEYNTPFSKNSHPLICDTGNLYRAHCALQRVTLLNFDFEVLNSYVDETTLLYIDPPYAPISKTSNFTRYNGKGFTNTDQLRLAQWCQFLNEIGAKLIISNSAPNDGSVHRLYDGFRVETVSAKRSISADPTKRSNVNELIITNLTP